MQELSRYAEVRGGLGLRYLEKMSTEIARLRQAGLDTTRISS